MAQLALPLMIAGAGLKAYGSLKAGNQAKKTLYGEAQSTEAVAAANELDLRHAALKQIGDQRAAQGANGFTADSGSAVDALHESYVNMAMDVLNLRRDAAGKARALRAEGDMRQSQGRMGAVAALIGAASSAAGAGSDWAAARAGGGG